MEPKKSKRSGIKLILGGALLAVAVFIVIRFFNQSPSQENSGETPAAASGLERLEELRQRPDYRDLTKFGSWPLPFNPKGKSNPFLSLP